jgi:arylsulfatase A-like enzyme
MKELAAAGALYRCDYNHKPAVTPSCPRLGQYNAGYRGDLDAQTPAINKLAAEGLVLERFYVHKWCVFIQRSSLL